MREAGQRAPKILWVDDDVYHMDYFIGEFLINRYDVQAATNADDALKVLEEASGGFDLIILDVRLPPGKSFAPERTHGGHRTGIVLAERILATYPGTPLLGFSVCTQDEVGGWFTSHNQHYLRKTDILDGHDLFKHVEAIIRRAGGVRRLPKIFIVHGQDSQAKLDLKNYLQNVLNLGEPVILHEQPSAGKTIIEKFEEESAGVDVVFALLTPDDLGADASWANDLKRRARQNVIFELGYFLGKLQRRSGSIILCYSGLMELPSDISGMVYIDISQGVQAAGEEIRRELREWLL